MKPMSAITSDATSDEEEFNDEETTTSDEQDSNTTIAICECGRSLERGWLCSHCRRSCPNCNRALSVDPGDYCERCFRMCLEHGIYSISTAQCPHCKK